MRFTESYEERMKTMQAEYKTDIARLAEDMAKRDAEATRRETSPVTYGRGLHTEATKGTQARAAGSRWRYFRIPGRYLFLPAGFL